MFAPLEELRLMAPSRLRAPSENRGILAVPPLADAGSLLRINRQRLQASPLDLGGRTLSELRDLAVRETLEASRRFMESLGIAVPESLVRGAPALVVTGHQPEFFHPGVWVKNFAIHGLALAHGLMPLNLIVDNDLAKSTSIRVPVASSGSLEVVSVPFDQWSGPAPYEELRVRDENLFSRFPEEVVNRMRSWGLKPMVGSGEWAVSSKGRRDTAAHSPLPTPLLGERLAVVRRRLEERWGCRNWELPVSRLCQTSAFSWFACHILANVERFHETYNRHLHAYRARHGIRSRSHPVPDLDVQGEWFEAPFWVWQAGAGVRERLFVRRSGSRLELRNPQGTFGSLPLESRSDLFAAAAQEWPQLANGGIKVRTRALTTTMFARVFVADLFVHGIGGAIYDELTDDIIRDFYTLEPPGYFVLSGTLRLPLPSDLTTPPALATVQQQLRDAWYNPDRHLEASQGTSDVFRLCEEKRAWIARRPENSAERLRRFQAIHQLNEALRKHVTEQRELLAKREAEEGRKWQAHRIANDREYAFCLFPEEELQPFCGQFLTCKSEQDLPRTNHGKTSRP